MPSMRPDRRFASYAFDTEGQGQVRRRMKFTGSCADCGEPVRHDVQRCRECYLDNAFARSAKGKSNSRVVPADEQSAFARMDAKFCAAMNRAIEAGLEKLPG